MSTVIGGAPNRPSASTSQPARRSTSLRAAARQVKLATVAPVTKPTEDFARQVEQVEQASGRDRFHGGRAGVAR